MKLLGCALTVLTAAYFAVGALVLMWLIDTGLYSGWHIGIYAFVGASLLYARRFPAQWRADADAKQVVEMLLGGKTPDDKYVLYLRPFVFDGEFVVGTRDRFDIVQLLQTDREWEGFLARALQKIDRSLMLLGLARRVKQFGFGRVLVSDEAWKSCASRMIESAGAVIVVLSDRAGTAWETDYIMRNGHGGKTVFIQPPKPRRSKDDQDAYEGARAILRRFNWDLPPREKRLRAFLLNDQTGEALNAKFGWETGTFAQIIELLRVALRSTP